MGNKEKERQLSETEICMVLDTFMYLDYREAQEGTSLKNIIRELENHPDYGGGGIHYGEYTILSQAAENEAIGNLVIGCQSKALGYSSGTAACVFQTPDEETVYVVYRGTGDGEWPDNGNGMTESRTTQQMEALRYFEEAMEKLDVSDEQRLVITGHSKGGNKAQFVTMEAAWGERIDACYSVDGQGFSESAISRWKEAYGEEEYQKRTQKIKGIHGENDYVSVLGNSIIPKDNIRYIKTPVEKGNFAGYHDIKYMFASLEYDVKTQSYVTTFHGRKNMDASAQGELGQYAAALSEDVMELAPDQRDGCAAVVMQLMEATSGMKTGINGERLQLSDVSDFTLMGIPIIVGSLFQEEGKELLGAWREPSVLTSDIPGYLILQVDDKRIRSCGQELENIVQQLKEMEEQLREMAAHIPLYMKGSVSTYYQMRQTEKELGKLQMKLQKAAWLQEQAGLSYQKWNEEMIKEIIG